MQLCTGVVLPVHLALVLLLAQSVWDGWTDAFPTALNFPWMLRVLLSLPTCLAKR